MIAAGASRKVAKPSSRKPPKPIVSNQVQEGSECSFCGQVAAAVSVQMPVLHRKKRFSTPYCLACYYTTAAVRQEATKYVSVLNREQLEEQMPPLQQLFSEVYVELHKELQEESVKAFSKQKSDPLALLHGGGMAPRRMTHRFGATKPGAEKTKAGGAADGGFLRSIPLPERLLKTQQAQAKLQQAQIARMNKIIAGTATSTASESSSLFKRRKPSRQSIWNLAMDPNSKAIDAADVGSSQHLDQAPACSCGSTNVKLVGNSTSRNQDLKKGETWGMKDRGDDIVSRYQCNECGKMWNEEG